MTRAEIERILAAAEACREALVAAMPFDDTARPDTTHEMGFSLATLKNLTFLLERDLRAVDSPM